MIIDVPEGKDPLVYVWGELVPGIGPAAAAFSAAVYAHSTLSLREFEAARLTIARVNGCLFCLDYRTERDGERVEEGSSTRSPRGAPAPPSASASAWPRSTPSASPPSTTGWTRTSGRGCGRRTTTGRWSS